MYVCMGRVCKKIQHDVVSSSQLVDNLVLFTEI